MDHFPRQDFFAEKASVPSHLEWGDRALCPEPRVSVIMPVYKRPEMFALALASVLAQDYESFEVVVVDNNEDPARPNRSVVEKAADDRVFYYRNEENLGMFGNWNRGIELSRAPFVTFCHDDDLLLPGALTRLMDLQPKAGEACILSAFNEIDAEGRQTDTTVLSKEIWPLRPKDHYRYTLTGQLLANISCGDGSLFGREQLIALGGYDAGFYPSSDYELNIRYAQRYGAVVNNMPTSCYRVADNESKQVFRQFPAANRRVHEQWLLPAGRPKWLVRRLIETIYRNAMASAEKMWSQPGASDQAVRLSWSDKALLWTTRTLDRVHKYTLI